MTRTISPFQGLRYEAQKIENLADIMAPPYDVIDDQYRQVLYDRNPYNVIRLILTKEEDGSSRGITKYEAAQQYLKDWKAGGVFQKDTTPQIYVYHQTYKLDDGTSLTRKGFIALRRLENFESGKIRPHEYTFAGPKADRLHLIKATQANLSCIFGIYSDPAKKVQTLLESSPTKKPLIDIVTDDGNRHQLWGVSDSQIQAEVDHLMESKTILIADGHHRYETALAYRDFRRSEAASVTGEEAFNSVMMYCCGMEDEGLIILPTHRVLNVAISLLRDEILERAQKFFEVSEFSKEQSMQAQEKLAQLSNTHYAFLVALKNGSLLLLSTDTAKLSKIPELSKLQPAVRELDVTILHQYLIPHVFGVEIGEEHDSIKIHYVKEAKEALKNVFEGNAQAAFLMNPTKITQVEAISNIGERMPHKSTFFYPKLLTGLVVNEI